MAGAFGVSWELTSSGESSHLFAKPPKLRVQPSELDLGQTYLGQSLTGVIKLRNVGDGELKIENIRAGCACSSLHLEKKIVPSGQEVQLTVTVGIRQEGQHAVFPVRISSNDLDAPESVVLVRADAAPPPIRTDPVSIDFGEVTQGGGSSRRLRLLKPDGKPWPATEPVIAEAAGGLVEAKLHCTPGKVPDAVGLLELSLRPSPNTSLGAFRETLSIRPAGMDHTVEVEVRGNIVPLYEVSPTCLLIEGGRVPDGKSIERRVLIRRTDGKHLPRLHSYTAPSCVTIRDTGAPSQPLTHERSVEVIVNQAQVNGGRKEGVLTLWLEDECKPLSVRLMFSPP
jgi:hypothetical protein